MSLSALIMLILAIRGKKSCTQGVLFHENLKWGYQIAFTVCTISIYLSAQYAKPLLHCDLIFISIMLKLLPIWILTRPKKELAWLLSMNQHFRLVIHVCLNFDLISVSTPNFADLLLIITHNGNQSKMWGWTDWHAERGGTPRSHPEHRISITPGRSHHR